MRHLACLVIALWLGGCVTTQTPAPVTNTPPPITDTPPVAEPAPPVIITPAPTPAPPVVTLPPAPPPSASNSVFSRLTYWNRSDMRPALAAFTRSCARWERRDPSERISAYHPEYGRISDWLDSCRAAQNIKDQPGKARGFFEHYFYPLLVGAGPDASGLITGYYQPEIQARKRADRIYSEPILAVPVRDSDRRLPRAQMGKASARVIAYGRPVDVFFMQIQGSGVLSFPSGQSIRAAYAANNDHAFTPIGRVLVARGEMTLDQTSKQAIENWMIQAGPEKSRALMNENERYIFFQEQVLKPGEGPVGAMQVPLTAMGSIAVDPKFHPYGAPVWITTHLPRRAGDYRGEETGQLVIAQDTGKAIKGSMRGDLYFGSGLDAGGRAGVMRHRASWAILLPKTLIQPTS